LHRCGYHPGSLAEAELSVGPPPHRDGEEFLALAARVPLKIHATPFPLEHANEALAAVRNGQVDGAAVLDVSAR
jgi:alcohol dehydrogenase, propanol-preferring